MAENGAYSMDTCVSIQWNFIARVWDPFFGTYCGFCASQPAAKDIQLREFGTHPYSNF